MNQVTAELRGERPVKIQLVFFTDDLCTCCPHKQGEDVCDANEKVKRYDRKVIEYFHLEEREYIYQEIVEKIRKEITPEIMADICDGCGWYPVSACREKILGCQVNSENGSLTLL